MDQQPTNEPAKVEDATNAGAAADVTKPTPEAVDDKASGSKVNSILFAKKVKPKPEEHTKRISLITMFKFATPFDWFLMLVGAICGMGHGVSMPLFAIILGNVFDTLNSADVSGTTDVAIKFCYLGAAAFVASFGQVTFFTITAERMTAKLRRRYLESILKQEVGYFDRAGTGTLVTRLSENSLLFREALGDKLGALFQFFAMFVGGIAVGFSFSWQLTLVIFAFLPLMAIAGTIMGKAIQQLTSGQLESYARAGSVAEETFQLFRTVTSYSLQFVRLDKYAEHLKYAEAQASKQGLSMGLGFGLMLFSVFITYSINTYLGAVLVTNSRLDAAEKYPAQTNATWLPSFCQVGQQIPQNCSSEGVPVFFETSADICNCAWCQCGCFYSATPGVYQFESTCFTGGDVMLTLLSVIIGSFALGQAAPSLAAFSKGKAATEQLLEVIDRVPLIDADSNEGEDLALPVRGAIDFKDISFAYPTRLEYPVFKAFNLSIPAGKRVAFVGESGCGKSTTIALLQRWYDPTGGSITLDGKDIRNVNIKKLRSAMGLVSQEPILFSTTIRENVRYGRPDATDAEIEEACKNSNAHDFIMGFPDGYETYVTSSLVSGGQRQRLCLSRALLRNPPILLLDEATSALDNESERMVNDAIQRLLTSSLNGGGSRTTIVIAHRLSSIQACDLIYVFEKGKVVETGAHEEILSKHPDGVYASFIKLSTAAAHKHDEHNSKSRVTLNGNSSFMGKADGLKSLPTEPVQKETDTETESTSTGAATAVVKAKKQKKYPIRKAFRFAYEDRWLFIPGILASSVYGITFPVYAILLSRFLSTYFLMNNAAILGNISKWSWAFFGLAAGMGISMTVQNWTFGTIGGRMTTRVRKTLFRHLLSMEVGYYDEKENAVGIVASKLGADAAMVKGAISDRIQLAVSNLAAIIAGFTIALTGSWKVALVVIATFPALVAAGAAQMMLMGGLANSDKKALELAGHTISESVYGIRTVTSFSMQTSIKTLYYEQLKGPMKAANRKGVVSGIAFAFTQCMQFFIFSLTFWYGSTLVAAEEITFGDLIQAIMGIFTAAMSVGQAAALAPDVGKGGAAVQSIFKMLERKSKIDPFSAEGQQPSSLMGDVSFENISFAYPTRPNVPILSNFSLNIPRGKNVAFVGSSGSGKSTLVLLLERFYDPGMGTIKIDGIDVKDLNPAWLRAQIGIVSQEPALFRGTILDNIRAGKPGATDEECIEAAKMANAHDFIMSFPDNYNTDLETASSTSGGQKQRIAIARCLIRNPKILLLDEATSALDEESQRIVQEALDKLLETSDRTTIVVAHRLSTIRNADTIVVLQHGVVVEMGSFEELTANTDGAFSALLKSQSH